MENKNNVPETNQIDERINTDAQCSEAVKNELPEEFVIKPMVVFTGDKKGLVKKINAVKVGLNNETLTKSGYNSYNGLSYFNLSDFMPAVNRLCAEQNIMCTPYFDKPNKMGYLMIVDGDGDGVMIVNAPWEAATVAGASAIQNEGAMMTYVKRYLYSNAFDIGGNDDAVDTGMEVREKIIRIIGKSIKDKDKLASYYKKNSFDDLTVGELVDAMDIKAGVKKAEKSEDGSRTAGLKASLSRDKQKNAKEDGVSAADNKAPAKIMKGNGEEVVIPDPVY